MVSKISPKNTKNALNVWPRWTSGGERERKYKRGEVGERFSYARLTIPEENKTLLVSSYDNIGLESLKTRKDYAQNQGPMSWNDIHLY